ncbi:MAG: PAS domain-containing protein, partial [Firmicutes bacterium]|nr:PAS domain-containing protein [Bacillota bacterium]
MAERTFDKKKIKELLNSEYLIPAIEWVAEQMPGGFFIYRADRFQEILYVNKAALHIFGCESEEEFREITGNSFFGLVHPADVDTVQKSIDAQIADKDNENLDYVEYRIIRKDGSIRWVDDYGHFAKLPGYGDVYYVFISDVTEKHYVREEINRRANVYQGLLEQFNAFADNSLAVTRANLTTGVIEEVRGKDLYPEDHEGGNVTESMRLRAESFIAEEDRKKFREIFSMENMLERYYKGLGSAVFVGYCRRMSGRHCFVKFSASAVIDPVSEDTIFFSSETEYNTEKVTEVLNKKVLAKQYDMVAYIVGNNYGVVIGDAENIGKGSIFPKEKDGVYTQYLREQVFPVISGTEKEINEISRKLMTETIARELKESDSYYVDVPCEIEGEIFNKRFSYYTIDEESQFYILLKSDMTDVLRKEHEMNELLSTALREMENANAAKTAFLSNMSHEIRTPMNAIVGLDNIALKSSDLSPQTREYLEKIGASAKHLLSIINNILDMSRIESGRVTLKNEKFSFGSMFEQINTMVQSQCMEKGLTYDCHAIGSLGEY